jgi:hypothetical protein
METLILYSCPFSKKRIGKPNDGGYVIANLPDSYDLFLSGGIADDNTFESDFLLEYPNILCYAFDGTIPAIPQPNDKIIFVRKNLGNINNNYITNLHEYMENKNNIFMKIDIEGHEFHLLPTFFENGYIQKIKQLVVEIHSPADIQLYPDYFAGLSYITNSKMFDLFHNMNKTHTLIHFHANNGCNMTQINGINIPHVFELTYIRNDFITEKIQNTEKLPTVLDMKNIVNKPDYELSGFPYSNYLKSTPELHYE